MTGYSKPKTISDEEWEKQKEDRFLKKNDFLFNLQDRFKGMPKEEIISTLRKEEAKAAVLMVNFEGDFNIGGVFRSGNCFNFSEMFYFGKKKRDKRGEVGVFNYSNIQFLDTFEKVKDLKNKYHFVALENNFGETKNIIDYVWKPNSLILVGSESNGIAKEFLEICDDFIEIPMFGTCRSFNAASAASIAMYDYIAKSKRL